MLRATPRLQAFRDVLAWCGYTDAGLVAKLGEIALPHPRLRNLPRLLYLAAGSTPLDVLARLFLLGVPVDSATVPFPVDELAEMGLVEPRGAQVAATVALCPYGDLILAMDHPARIAAGAAGDLVMGVAGSSVNLDHFSIRRHFHRALDLGTGCGVLALVAAAHCREVWAVDQCPRAVEFARFNAALNRRANVHVEEGDMFAPVAGHCFDFIVGNLPFVIAPGRRYFYRDNGGVLDSFARQTVRQAARQLEEGGFCQIMCDWVQVKGEDWRERLSSWFTESGCDAWVLRTTTTHPLTYAENWIRNSEPDTPGLAEGLFAEWARYYTDNSVESIMTGMIAMRRSRGQTNWVNLEDGSEPVPSDAGALVLRAFALCDFERGASDAQLLDTPLRLAPDVRLMAQSEARENTWQPAAAQLRQTAGFLWAGNIDSNAAALLARCDGTHPFSHAVAGLAADLNLTTERLAPSCLPLARQLLRRGFLLPPEL